MNIRFQRRTDLALSALQALVAVDGVMSRGDLAAAIDTTRSYVAQVMSPLVQAGWVRSSRGPGGGYRLTDSAFQARLLEVVEATEGPAAKDRCVLRDAPCPGEESCPIHAIWAEARRVLVDGFGGALALRTGAEGGSR